MKGDIAFAGFVLTAEEWRAFDSEARAQLLAVATSTELWAGPAVPESAGELPGLLAAGSGPVGLDDRAGFHGDAGDR